jgi:hypothetical protein
VRGFLFYYYYEEKEEEKKEKKRARETAGRSREREQLGKGKKNGKKPTSSLSLSTTPPQNYTRQKRQVSSPTTGRGRG